MKVILTMDVPDVGSRGDRLDVAAGYARNYLLPRQLAVPETRGNLARLAEESKLTGTRDKKARNEAEKVAAFLSNNDLLATLKIGREGKAFGAITSKDVGILLRQAGLEVDRRLIHMPQPIKRLGVFEVPLQLHSDVECLIKLYVDREGGDRDGAKSEQAQWDAAAAEREEAARLEAEARAEREREAEEAARLAIEKAEARRAREEEAKAEAEAAKAAKAGDDAEASDGDDSSDAPSEEETAKG